MQKEKRDRIEATKLRKERRYALREAYGLKKLTNNFIGQVVGPCQKIEYTPAVTVYDIREYHPTRENGVSVFGGFIGELLLVFTALYDFMLSNPANQEYKFGQEHIEKFLVDWMKEADFPEGTCVVKLREELHLTTKDAEGNIDVNSSAAQISHALKNPNAHQSFGLNFMLKNRKDVLINDTAIAEIFGAIAKVSLLETKEEKPLPAEGAENHQALLDATNAENETIKVHNDAINKLKSKISLQVPQTKYARPEDAETWPYPEDPSDYSFWGEKMYVKVQNYKEPEGHAVVEDSKPLDKKAQMLKDAEKAKLAAQAAEMDPNQEPPFEIERISHKIMVIPCMSNAAQIPVFVHHTDASHFIRRAIVERAAKVWAKDLKEMHLNQILGHCAQKGKALEDKMMEFVDQRLEWGSGQSYEDQNIKIIFNTFLKSNDFRVDNDVLNDLITKE